MFCFHFLSLLIKEIAVRRLCRRHRSFVANKRFVIVVGDTCLFSNSSRLQSNCLHWKRASASMAPCRRSASSPSPCTSAHRAPPRTDRRRRRRMRWAARRRRPSRLTASSFVCSSTTATASSCARNKFVDFLSSEMQKTFDDLVSQIEIEPRFVTMTPTYVVVVSRDVLVRRFSFPLFHFFNIFLR